MRERIRLQARLWWVFVAIVGAVLVGIGEVLGQRLMERLLGG